MQEQQYRPERRREESPEGERTLKAASLRKTERERARLPEMNQRTASLRKTEQGKARLPKTGQDREHRGMPRPGRKEPTPAGKALPERLRQMYRKGSNTNQE